MIRKILKPNWIFVSVIFFALLTEPDNFIGQKTVGCDVKTQRIQLVLYRMGNVN
jgi:hypothetical protein